MTHALLPALKIASAARSALAAPSEPVGVAHEERLRSLALLAEHVHGEDEAACLRITPEDFALLVATWPR
jgi:hypothetical protein